MGYPTALTRHLKTVQNGDVTTLFSCDPSDPSETWELVGNGDSFTLGRRRASLKESDLEGFSTPAFLVDTKGRHYSGTKTPIAGDLDAYGLYPEDYCPQDEDHPRLPWEYMVGFVYDDVHRGYVEAVPETVKSFDNGTPTLPVKGMACYQDWISVRCYAVGPTLDGKPPVAARLYRGRNGIFGLVAESTSTVGAYAYRELREGEWTDVTVATPAPAFELTDDGATPDLGRQPPEQIEGPGTERAVGFGYFEQRSVVAGSSEHPRRIWLSRTASPYEYTQAGGYVPLDSDAMELDLDTPEHETVMNVATVNGSLIVLTDRAIWAVAPGISPTSAKAVRFGGVGSCGLRPIAVRNGLVFVGADGAHVYEIRPDQSGTQWATRELGQFARHLLDGRRIVSWTYMDSPDQTIWMAMSDGTLLTLAYCMESGLCAWTRHEAPYSFEDVCAVDGPDGPVLFVSAKSEREGPTLLMRMDFRGGTRYLDGYRPVAGGEAVSGAPRWRAFDPMYPASYGGEVGTLPARATSGAAGQVVEGHPVRMRVELLDVDLYDDAGLRPKTLKRVAVDSVGNTSLRVSQAPGEYAPKEELSKDVRRRVTESYVVHGYAPHATGCIVSDEPSMATLLGAVREVDYGDTAMRR